MAAAANEPFYAKPPGKPAVLVIDDGLASVDEPVLRVFRPRVEPLGRLRYGAETSVQLEFWRVTDTEVLAPVENALMRRSLPIDEFVVVDIERYGRTWRTVEHMFDDHVSDIRFPIDIVFSWVDGNAIEYQRAARPPSPVPCSARATTPRPLPADRRAEVRAPFRAHVRAVDPPDLHRHGLTGAEVARGPPEGAHRAERGVLRDPSVLPTHNSQAVESQLHHIPASASTSSTRTTTCSSGAWSTRRCSSARGR